MRIVENLVDITVFARVAEMGSLTAAARELGMSLPVVSKRLARLEQRLGMRLVSRTTRHLALTEDGRDFQAHCRRILAQIDEMEAALALRRGEVIGQLRITSTVAFGTRILAPLIAEFLCLHPAMRIHLAATDTMVDLMTGGFDLAIRFGAMPDSQILAHPLAPNHRVVCGAPAYLARRGQPAHPRDLEQHDCILSGDAPQDHWRFRSREGEEVPVQVTGVASADHGEVAQALALAGAGLLVKSIWEVGPEVKQGRLQIVLPGWHVPGPPLQAVHAHGRLATPRLSLFLDFLRGKLRTGWPWDDLAAAGSSPEPRERPPLSRAGRGAGCRKP
ncbi:LysR family transcriptional regulator [Roseomonas gilardii subsp. gilardii]|uniref:LysR family transcriptional regulator n=1 Tax=Roseomonas gilardii TaxID=257708 RepID=UPI001FF97BE2|nr:LysR family transcriptional regulator [Roseomonas gilardii]UPG73086.1 LysR family transcriptional regulator [Roseomonas gilardii subsp. gilardii]